MNLLNVRAIGPNGFIDFLIYNVPLGFEKTRWPFYLLVGVLFFALYYFTFRFAISKFNLKTIGREDSNQETRLYSKEDYEQKKKGVIDVSDDSVVKLEGEFGLAPTIVQALGGSENINYITNCYSRLRLTVDDPSKVNEAVLKNETGASGVVVKDQNVQVVYGLQVNKIRRAVEEYLGRTSDE